MTLRPLPDPRNAISAVSGQPTKFFYDYLREADELLRSLIDSTTPVAFADLPTGTAGQQRFVSNGRKAGEGAGSGTGVLAYFDGSNWIATDTGAPVAA